MLARGGSALALTIGLMHASAASAQTTAAQTGETPAEQAPAEPARNTPADQADVGESGNENEIVVTGSRIERAGFDQPTPTTVLGDTELRQGARPNLQQILNDQPQVRPTVTPTTTLGNTGSGSAPVDLRGLGTARTLTLINGRRFVGENNLNYIPLNVVKRLEVVTGGASAAWGSGAVAGVVNIILDDDLQGLTLGAQAGISEHGDGERYGFDGSFGTSFADDRGHFMVGVEYVDDKGIGTLGRRSRPGLRGGGLTFVNGAFTLADDVNNGTRSETGLIRSGVLAGQTFNNDGTLRPYRGPNASGIGGEDASGLYDHIVVSVPFDRLSAYGRLSYDIGGATVWLDAAYGKVNSNYEFFPDFTTPGDFGGGPLTVQASNPFLSPAIRNQLAAAGQTSFTFGRTYTDIFMFFFDSERENKEAAIGIDGTFGSGWKYSAHYSHGEVDSRQELRNSRVAANFSRAVNAVLSGGQIVCAVNADTNPANDDPACRPLNIFGSGNASPEALAYVRATQDTRTVSKLDAASVEVQGDLFSLWAGPITVAIGAEARWESQDASRSERTRAGGFGLPVFTSEIDGKFNVKEGFGEIVVPLLDAEALKLEFNGAARYSDYSTSGGIWSWKLGGTARLFNDLLLRATRSRDIRSASIGELFAVQAINIGPQVDRDTAGRTGIPGYNPNPATVTTFTGGNPDLVPEIGKTLAVGASYSPSFLTGLSLSVDYYDIKITGAITALSASNLTLACSLGSQAACNRIVRDPVTQTLVTVFTNQQNIASFETNGFDIEAAYVMPLSRIADDVAGTVRFRALATYVDKYVSNSGLGATDTAGDVGGGTGLPHWRGTFSATYQSDQIGLDARVRYVGGGKFNQLLNGTNGQPNLVNNDIASRTYVDIGAQFRVVDKFTFFGSINNLLGEDPPIITTATPHYDVVGRYFTFGARVDF